MPDGERVKLLREVADLWSERFGNFANAIKPLERIVELAPTDTDAVSRLKEIYTKRRQWRQLIDLIGKEAAPLPPDERRAKRAEMARLAAERLGDTRLAIEIYNTILGEAGGDQSPRRSPRSPRLYDREKRYLAFAEILHRQRKALGGKDAIALLEKLGQVYSDRLGAPQQAAAAWKEVLDIEPNHAKALRTLRELYAMAGDFAGLEQLYAKLGQEDELVEALLAIADRLDAKAAAAAARPARRRSSRRSVPMPWRRRRRRSKRRARCGSACSPSSRFIPARPRRSRRSTRSRRSGRACSRCSRSSSRLPRSRRTGSRRSRRSASCASRSSRARRSRSSGRCERTSSSRRARSSIRT